MIKKREFVDSNYRGIWYSGKTMRIALNPDKPITELEYPEFYDVKITGNCLGECPWCYMDSKTKDNHYEGAVQKIKDFFGPMDENQRPFQVAIGGGEPTSHPDFVEYPLNLRVVRAAQQITDIPELHDRLIAATAKALDTKLITNDLKIQASSFVQTIW